MPTNRSQQGTQLAATGWRGSNQDGGGSITCLEVLLDHESPQGMTQQDGGRGQRLDDRGDIADVVRNRAEPERLARRATPVAAQAGRQNAEPAFDEVVE